MVEVEDIIVRRVMKNMGSVIESIGVLGGV